ncbi:MAG: tyrosine--tRNA ligase [Candidatus Omnitrophica bacterium]|nr:tyrosine--tRNA ligase [Candidatus Omnitrophota bacterium]
MSVEAALQVISRGTVEIISRELLEKKLTKSAATGKPLVVKAGFDPTAPDIHLGHVVLLRKMKQFQDLGHRVVFLIGDFTAQIGDPTGQNKLRKHMTPEDVQQNARTYKEQVFKVLDPVKTEVVFNSSWFNAFSAQQLLMTAMLGTANQVLAREDFQKRIAAGKGITLTEMFYPMLQGYDSVHLKADVELGGSDQKFNLLMGRQIQEASAQEPQVVIMTPLLEGLDGVNKMSKSLGNYVGINELPRDMFGKIMSVSDELMFKYFELLTDENLDGIRSMHPKEAKLKLAGEIVRQFHGTGAAGDARTHFESVFAKKEIPDDVQEYALEGALLVVDILVQSGVAPSRNEARRLLKQNAVTFEGTPVADETWKPKPGILKIGKRRFLKLV